MRRGGARYTDGVAESAAAVLGIDLHHHPLPHATL